VANGGALTNYAGVTQPSVSLIVKYEVRAAVSADQAHWYDELN
jgi:hypothetical protein